MQDPILREVPLQLETARLIMRAPRAGDGAMLHEAIMASLTPLREFSASLPWAIGEQSAQASEIYARHAQADFLARRGFSFLLFGKDTGAFIGSAGVMRPDWSTPKAEIGYWCHAAHAGQGYITEAAQELVRLGFAELGLARLEILCDEQNLASRKVAEKCGFALEGVLRNDCRDAAGVLRNTCVYSRFP